MTKEIEPLERMRDAMERRGIRPKDPKHPLAEYPPDHLKKAIALLYDSVNFAGFKKFVSSIFNIGEFKNASERAVSNWLRDSRTIGDNRLAELATLIALQNSTFPCEKCALYQTWDTVSFEDAYELTCDCIFTLSRFDREAIMRLAISASLEKLDERELRTVCGVIGMRETYGITPCCELAEGTPTLEGFEKLLKDLSNAKTEDYATWGTSTLKLLETIGGEDDYIPFT